VTALPLILPVEDNANDLEMTREAFKKSRIANENVTVRDGMAAVAYLHHCQPLARRSVEDLAVVLLDLKLAKVDGLEVLRTVKAILGVGHLPVVVLT
jgi:CheY-like chemotaxis protein